MSACSCSSLCSRFLELEEEKKKKKRMINDRHFGPQILVMVQLFHSRKEKLTDTLVLPVSEPKYKFPSRVASNCKQVDLHTQDYW